MSSGSSPNNQISDSSSNIIQVAVIVGFIVVFIFALTLFLKITRSIRSSRERKRANDALNLKRFTIQTEKPKSKSRGKLRNAFEEEVEWEGVPA